MSETGSIENNSSNTNKTAIRRTSKRRWLLGLKNQNRATKNPRDDPVKGLPMPSGVSQRCGNDSLVHALDQFIFGAREHDDPLISRAYVMQLKILKYLIKHVILCTQRISSWTQVVVFTGDCLSSDIQVHRTKERRTLPPINLISGPDRAMRGVRVGAKAQKDRIRTFISGHT
ncbi:hypothetical protein M9H77_16992 [Catharanthus roseus]|uniref:Uncharacterized protein n=1 Tax=Catharanthus roseus TaxID=4058 RepID=A0ACC0B3B8_CATRO|nr:hypothetical protein M9H77_16992 [Catharanthus roseus]